MWLNGGRHPWVWLILRSAIMEAIVADTAPVDQYSINRVMDVGVGGDAYNKLPGGAVKMVKQVVLQ